MASVPGVHGAGITALLVLAGCVVTKPERAPDETTLRATGRATLSAQLGSLDGARLEGHAPAPLPETDQLPQFSLSLAGRALGIVAVDAAIVPSTRSLAWIAPDDSLWLAPLDRAPRDKQLIARRAIVGLAAAGSRLAFATRIAGPDTAPFVVDTRTLAITALADGPGPDEILAFSPNGAEVLVLSGRTGLASLFALGAAGGVAKQLTNVGLAPGRTLDPSKVVPAPIDRRALAWGPRGIAYRAERSVVVLTPGGTLRQLDASAWIGAPAPKPEISEAQRSVEGGLIEAVVR